MAAFHPWGEAWSGTADRGKMCDLGVKPQRIRNTMCSFIPKPHLLAESFLQNFKSGLSFSFKAPNCPFPSSKCDLICIINVSIGCCSESETRYAVHKLLFSLATVPHSKPCDCQRSWVAAGTSLPNLSFSCCCPGMRSQKLARE